MHGEKCEAIIFSLTSADTFLWRGIIGFHMSSHNIPFVPMGVREILHLAKKDGNQTSYRVASSESASQKDRIRKHRDLSYVRGDRYQINFCTLQHRGAVGFART